MKLSKLNFLIHLICPVLLFTLDSCGEELIQPDDINRDNKYLYNVTEVDASSADQEIKFSQPRFQNGQIISCYVNFTGLDANHYYEFQDNIIILEVFKKDGQKRKWKYTVDEHRIQSAECTITGNGRDENSSFTYSYDDKGRLIKIQGNPKVDITWNGDNIEKISPVYNGSDFALDYEFEYGKNKSKENMPMFFLSCFYTGGLMGVDEILALEGYFGTVTSSSLPVREYYLGDLSATYEYNTDKDGYITTAKRFKPTNNKLISTFYFDWR